VRSDDDIDSETLHRIDWLSNFLTSSAIYFVIIPSYPFGNYIMIGVDLEAWLTTAHGMIIGQRVSD